MRWTLVLERLSENALHPPTVRKHLKYIAEAAERNQSLGFSGKVGRLAEPQTVLHEGKEKKRYLVRVRLEENKARSAELARERFEHVLGVVTKAANTKGWKVIGQQGGSAGTGEKGEGLAPVRTGPRPPFRPVDLTDEVIAREFADVYQREAHLRLINDSVQTAVASNWEIRDHTLLYGEPGGCKSTLFERLKKLYEKGEDLDRVGERVGFVDMTAATKAGLETWILEQALRAFRKGFIFDRFSNQLHCPLPDRETIYLILLDKVKRVPGGNPLWAEKALLLADGMRVRTPRKVIGFLAGRDRLLTGKYQQDKLHISRMERAEKEALAAAWVP